VTSGSRAPGAAANGDAVISAGLRERLARIPTSDLTTISAQRGLPRMFMSGVRPLRADLPRMVSQAVTLRHIPSRPDLDTIESFSEPEAL
jgi:hypothetical protein